MHIPIDYEPICPDRVNMRFPTDEYHIMLECQHAAQCTAERTRAENADSHQTPNTPSRLFVTCSAPSSFRHYVCHPDWLRAPICQHRFGNFKSLRGRNQMARGNVHRTRGVRPE